MSLISKGIHHVTAIASDPQKNLDFYAGVLGMRFVKGFTIDEPLEKLGQSLKLPEWLETRRFEIEALLPNIRLPMEIPGPNA